MSGNDTRIFKTEITIKATPEEVWKALATGEGWQSWFAPEARVNPGQGGSIWISWGPGMEGEFPIEVWDPAKRLVYKQDRPDRDPVVVEFRIESAGGATTLYLVQSGFGADATFDNEYESTSRAWLLFLHLMQHCVETPHRVARNVTVFRIIDRPRQEVWNALPADGGVVTFDDGVGCRSVEVPDGNGSITGIFCEKCGGKTMLTVMAILYDPEPGVEDRVREEWTAKADSLATAPVAS